jgi:hypothetical protein
MATGEVVPTSSGSRLIIRTQMHPQGLLRPLAPLPRRYMQHAGTATSPPSRPDSTTQTTQPPIHIPVVYESLLANTHEIAEAIEADVADALPDATVDRPRGRRWRG